MIYPEEPSMCTWEKCVLFVLGHIFSIYCSLFGYGVVQVLFPYWSSVWMFYQSLKVRHSSFLFYLFIYYYYTLSCRVHVHNVHVCYICILVPCCCAAPINSSFTSGITPNAIPPPSPLPMIGPGVWCSPSQVQVISLFSSHLWVRTCGVWFSVLVIVC